MKNALQTDKRCQQSVSIRDVSGIGLAEKVRLNRVTLMSMLRTHHGINRKERIIEEQPAGVRAAGNAQWDAAQRLVRSAKNVGREVFAAPCLSKHHRSQKLSKYVQQVEENCYGLEDMDKQGDREKEEMLFVEHTGSQTEIVAIVTERKKNTG